MDQICHYRILVDLFFVSGDPSVKEAMVPPCKLACMYRSTYGMSTPCTDPAFTCLHYISIHLPPDDPSREPSGSLLLWRPRPTKIISGVSLRRTWLALPGALRALRLLARSQEHGSRQGQVAPASILNSVSNM